MEKNLEIILANDIIAATGARAVVVSFSGDEVIHADIDGVSYTFEVGSDDDAFVFQSPGRSDIVVQFSPEWLAAVGV